MLSQFPVKGSYLHAGVESRSPPLRFEISRQSKQVYRNSQSLHLGMLSFVIFQYLAAFLIMVSRFSLLIFPRLILLYMQGLTVPSAPTANFCPQQLLKVLLNRYSWSLAFAKIDSTSAICWQLLNFFLSG